MSHDKDNSQVVRVAYETMQFFEVDLPEGQTPESYIGTDDFREACADLISSGFIDFQVERKFNAEGEEV